MKNEKLELSLNKVVDFYRQVKVDGLEFNQTVLNCKGFLYKDNGGYYVKVIEFTECQPNSKVQPMYVQVNDKIRLIAGDENNITIAQKPKLMRVSLKSWHYRLIKYILRDNAPTPKTMQNGCPYFWLLVLSMLALPFVLIGKGVKFSVLLVPKALIWCLEKMIEAWIKSLDDATAYEMYWKQYSGNGYAKMPATAKLFFNNSDADFYDYFLLEKYNLSSKISPEEYQKKKKEISEEWEKFRQERQAKRQIEQEAEYKARAERQRKESIQEARRLASKAKWDARMKPWNDGVDKIVKSIGQVFTSIKKLFTLNADWKTLIKRTKQVVGAIITLLVLAGTYFLVNAIAFALTVFVDFSITNWRIYAFIGILAAILGIGYIIVVIVGSWLQNVVNKYQHGKKVWYIEPLIYGVWYPIKFIGLFLAYAVVYILWIPVKFIFYKFLWNIILVNTGKFLWKVMTSLGRGLANSTGVFGEYFGASYSDYCPGIEWADVEEPVVENAVDED